MADNNPNKNEAADIIRHKLDQLYSTEPSAKAELDEADHTEHRSKHQKFMYELGHSGKSLAEIQTAWHTYYNRLTNKEKHEVWQEFYEEHNRKKTDKTIAPAGPIITVTPAQPPIHAHSSTHKPRPRNIAVIKDHLLGQVQSQAVRKAKRSHSLLFGLACGSIAVVILLFGFFNERFIAPFITPSRSVSNTSIIIDPSTTAAGKEPLIIIPKINVEIPVVYDENSIEEAAVQKALERGVIHYATTVNPGEKGNGVIFGHSSNNIFNSGKYKFAFVLLKRLEKGDTFMLQKDGKRYVYKVYDKKIIKPEEVSILSDQAGKAATFTLITCDPPGTTINRLVVLGEQISPDPAKNVASKVERNRSTETLPGNAPSLWSRLTSWLSS